MKEQLLAALLELFQLCMTDPEIELPQVLLMMSDLEKVGIQWKKVKAHFADNPISFAENTESSQPMSPPSSIRMFTREEMLRLDTDSRGLILELEQQGILSPELREKLIELAMESSSRIISPEEIKWLALKVVAKSAIENMNNNSNAP